MPWTKINLKRKGKRTIKQNCQSRTPGKKLVNLWTVTKVQISLLKKTLNWRRNFMRHKRREIKAAQEIGFGSTLFVGMTQAFRKVTEEWRSCSHYVYVR